MYVYVNVYSKTLADMSNDNFGYSVHNKLLKHVKSVLLQGSKLDQISNYSVGTTSEKFY